MLIDWFTVLAQVVNFIVLVYLLKRFLYGPIVRAMKGREEKMGAAMERAKAAEEAAGRMAKDLEREQQALADNRATLLAEAKEEVDQWRQKTVEAARLEIERMRESWKAALERDKRGFVERLKRDVTRQVLRISEKTLQDLANQRIERHVIERFLEKVEERRDIFPAKGLQGPVLVQSGFELDEQISQHMGRRIGEWMNNRPTIRFEVLGELGMGIQLMVGDQKVTWNLAEYLEDLEKEILANLTSAGQKTI